MAKEGERRGTREEADDRSKWQTGRLIRRKERRWVEVGAGMSARERDSIKLQAIPVCGLCS